MVTWFSYWRGETEKIKNDELKIFLHIVQRVTCSVELTLTTPNSSRERGGVYMHDFRIEGTWRPTLKLLPYVRLY